MSDKKRFWEKKEKQDQDEISPKEYPILTKAHRGANFNAILGFFTTLLACFLSWSYLNFAGAMSLIGLIFCLVSRAQTHADVTQTGLSWANAGILLSILGILINIVYLILKLGFHII